MDCSWKIGCASSLHSPDRKLGCNLAVLPWVGTFSRLELLRESEQPQLLRPLQQHFDR